MAQRAKSSLLTIVFLIFEFSFVYLRALRGLIFSLGIFIFHFDPPHDAGAEC